MQSTAPTLHYYFAVIILIGVLWMVIQKVVKLVGLWEVKEVNEVIDGSDICNEQKPNISPEIRTQCHLIKNNITQQGSTSSFQSNQNDYSQNLILNSEYLVSQHGYFKSKLGIRMASDTDDTMAEPTDSTNYTSGGGKCYVRYRLTVM